MRYYSEEYVRNIHLIPVEEYKAPQIVNIRFCRDCPLFDINGIQPDPGIIHGRCLRFSDEYVPYYVRVDDTDFCNEDKIEDEILQ